jgi:hypothetical protein
MRTMPILFIIGLIFMQGMSRNCVGLHYTKIKVSVTFIDNEGELIILVLHTFRAINICIRLCSLATNCTSEHLYDYYFDIWLDITGILSEYRNYTEKCILLIIPPSEINGE